MHTTQRPHYQARPSTTRAVVQALMKAAVVLAALGFLLPTVTSGTRGGYAVLAGALFITGGVLIRWVVLQLKAGQVRPDWRDRGPAVQHHSSYYR